MRKLSVFAHVAIGALLVAGCAGAPLPVNYAPSSVMTAEGSLSVGEFRYLPAERSPQQTQDPVEVKKSHRGSGDVSPGYGESETNEPSEGNAVAPNQIRNSAIGKIFIDREVKTYVRDAVFAELRFVGVKVNDPGRVLRGDIEEFFVGDLGYSVDWLLRMRYELRDPGGRLLYQATKETKRKTAKFANAFGALNETVKLSVEELLRDPDFTAAVK